MRSKWIPVTSLGAAAVLVVAGCGSSSSSTTTSSSAGSGAYGGSTSTASSGAATGGPAVVSTGVTNNAKIGSKPVLVNSKGFTLYWFEKDPKNTTKSSCSGGCAAVWPPMITTGKPTVSGAAIASKLGTIKRSDGTLQVTYAGFLLYTYAADKKPGDAAGNDIKSFGASWYALTPKGDQASG